MNIGAIPTKGLKQNNKLTLKLKRMKTIQINVGLNNNPLTEDEVISYFSIDKNYRLMAYQIVDSEFNGNVEPTFVGLFEHKYTNQSKILADFERVCSVMTQESIAIVTDRMSVLTFNPNYKGEDYKFDSRYFKYIKL